MSFWMRVRKARIRRAKCNFVHRCVSDRERFLTLRMFSDSCHSFLSSLVLQRYGWNSVVLVIQMKNISPDEINKEDAIK